MTAERWQRAKAIFLSVVETDSGVRGEFLRERCGDDDELRREVESLLASEKDELSLLATATMNAGLMAPPPPAVIGDRYEVEREVGRGGMSVVYLARDRQLLGKRVVIKVLLETAGLDPWIRQKFRQEMEALSRIDHPGVVGVLDTGLTPEGKQFLVMQYIEGVTLRRAIEPGGMNLTRAAGIIRQIGQALGAAHEKGVWHRDLKPENIMLQRLTAEGSEDHVKLIDFGIAGIQNSHFAGEKTKVAGSVSYMAPEQVAGRPCAASDTYALAVVAHEVLTGTRPGDTDEPGQTLPRGAREAIQRALSLRPEDRQSSVREFSEELYRALTGQETARRSANAKWKQPLPLVAALALIALIAAGGALWFGMPSLSGPDQQSVAVLPFRDLSPANDQQYFSEGVAEELLNALAKIPGLRVAGRNSAFQIAGKTVDYRVIGQKLHVAAILEGSIGRQGNRAKITARLINASDGYQLWSETYNREMSDIFFVQEDIARAVTGALKIALAGGKAKPTRSVNPDAYSAYLQGRYFFERRNKANIKKAVGYFEQATTLDPAYALAWAWLAEARSREAVTGGIDAKATYELARRAATRALMLDPDLAEAHATLAWIKQFAEWDWIGADASFKRALALSPGNATVISNAGMLARSLGHLDEASALGRRAMEIDPLNSTAFYYAGATLYDAGLHQEATAALAKALELVPEREMIHYFLGQVLLAQSRPKEALTEMKLEKSEPFRLVGLALAYRALEQNKESDANLKELIDKYGSEATYFIAAIYAYRGEKDRAFEWLDRAYDVRETALVSFKVEPLMKSLVGDPRHTDLLKKLRLPL